MDDTKQRLSFSLEMLRGTRALPPGDADRLAIAHVFETELKRLETLVGGNHKLSLIPMVDADDLPEDAHEYCMEQDYPLHCSAEVVEVYLDEENPLATWLADQGYQFPPERVEWGWGHIALMGS